MIGGRKTTPGVLVCNAGSSSLKVALLLADRLNITRAECEVRNLGEAAQLRGTVDEETFSDPVPGAESHASALRHALAFLDAQVPGWSDSIRVVGHRVVHGGSLFTRPTVMDTSEERALERLQELAPLHNRASIAVIREAMRILPSVAHVACFDTAFHTDLPPASRNYALPRQLMQRFAIRRYGFHGLSCTWSLGRVSALEAHVPDRVIICHLGAGASVTAVLKGKSFDTTMGFTPLDGLVMATRSGSIDPAILIYLLRHADVTVDEIENMLERESGLLALSGVSGDVRTLETNAGSGDVDSATALDTFAYHVRVAIGGFWAALGGLDALVLTGGIPENSDDMRRRILEPLTTVGLNLAASPKPAGEGALKLSAEGARPVIWLIPAQEDRVIAAQSLKVLQAVPK